MNISGLKTQIAQILHRTDLSAQMDNFISDASERINRRFGIALPLPVDPDSFAPGVYQLYLFGSLVSAHEFLNNGDNAKYYDDKWELEADRQNVLSPNSVLDPYAGTFPVVTRGENA